MDLIHKIQQLPKTLSTEPIFEVVAPEKRRLGLFLLLAALVHLSAFWLVEISYPQPPIKTASRLRVSLSEPSGPSLSNRASLRLWYALQDPSLLIRPQDPLVDTAKTDLIPIKHQTTPGVQPLTLPARDEKISFLPDGLPSLSERVESTMETPGETFSYPGPIAATANTTTMLSLDPVLAARLATALPTLPRQTSSLLTESGTSILRLGLAPDGRVAHALIEQSCGKTAVDLIALNALRKLHFQPASNNTSLLWGQVTVYWQFEPEPAPAAPATAAPAPSQ